MKLSKIQIEKFRSIEDTTEFSVGDLTCLVGKNEAGKTAILKALEAQFPYNKTGAGYDFVRDYPRRFYSDAIAKDPKPKIKICKTSWLLNDEDVKILQAEFGEDCMSGSELQIESYYNFSSNSWSLPIDQNRALEYLINSQKFNAAERSALGNHSTSQALFTTLESISPKTEKQETLYKTIKNYPNNSILFKVREILEKRIPKFFYVSHYDRMSGQISVEYLAERKRQGQSVDKGDEIFQALLRLAGTSLEELRGSTRLEDLKAKCEAASNRISQQIFEYWTQNDALDVQIDISTGKTDDPPPFNSGTIVGARVYNSNHRASVPFSERSAGFVWFFSFLVQFAEIKNSPDEVIILLDEPGLTLHGKAQSDLLRYIENELLPFHQVIYTTHSPFLVPADRFADVRVVEDVLEYSRNSRPIVKGTKVFEDILSTDRDTLFPLQGALGYDLCQALFIGKNTLLVEGPSDILFLQALSSALKKRNRVYLDPNWTLCPSGGIDKIQPFISLFSGNKTHLDVAVLTDQGMGDKTKIEKLKRSNILQSDRFYSVADFTKTNEADIEDLFETKIYVDILNASFELNDNKLTVEKLINADVATTRLVKKAEAIFRLMPINVPTFDHFTPAAWLIRNSTVLDSNESETLITLERAEQVFKTFNDIIAKGN